MKKISRPWAMLARRPGRPPGPATSGRRSCARIYILRILIVKRIKSAFYNKNIEQVRVDGSVLI